MSSIFLFSCHVLNLSFPPKLRCGPQRGITITKVHVRIVLCHRDSCGRNLTLASLFLPSCGYLNRQATALGRPRWPPLHSAGNRWSRAETANFHRLTVNRVAHLVWWTVTEGFCLKWISPPLCLNPNINPNTWAYESNRQWITLNCDFFF